MDPDSDQSTERARARLAQFFDADERRRFRFERRIGSGAFGVAWMLQYRPAADEDSRRLILKTTKAAALFYDDQFVKRFPVPADDYEGGDDPALMNGMGMERERYFLRLLRWAKHIVQIVEPADDPLGRELGGGVRRRLSRQDYMFLEYVENGVVQDFMTRCSDAQIQRLPNRFLWRCFLCLLRMCTAMAWPPGEPEEGPDGPRWLERVGQGRGGGLSHGDLHAENVMFGPLINDPDEPEHDMVPILKAIDFGSALDLPDPIGYTLQPTAISSNLFEVGVMMCIFITLDPVTAYFMGSGQSNTGWCPVVPDGPVIETAAHQLLPNDLGHDPFPDLDRDLRNAVCGCVATDPTERPPVGALLNIAAAAVRRYDAEYYKQRGDADGTESDENVKWIVQEFIFNGNTTDSSLEEVEEVEEPEEMGEIEEVEDMEEESEISEEE